MMTLILMIAAALVIGIFVMMFMAAVTRSLTGNDYDLHVGPYQE